MAPPQSAGSVNLSVATPAGVSAPSAAQYQYQGTPPSVSAVSPNRGPTAGGTVVVLTGSNLNGATQVHFDGTPALSFTVDSATQITATAPAHAVGAIHVTVTNPYGTSSGSTESQFTYAALPTVTAISPAAGAPKWSSPGRTSPAWSGTLGDTGVGS